MNGEGRWPKLRLLPIALCFVAGYIDACAFIALFGTFVAQITGTYIIAGATLVTHEPGVLTKVLAIPVFMAGAAIATLIARTAPGAHPLQLVTSLLLEFVLLLVFLFSGLSAAQTSSPDATGNVIAAIAGFAAMGVQSALVRIFYVGAPSTNVMTMATSQIAIDTTDVLLSRRFPDPARTDAARRRLYETLPHVAAFLVGATAGALAFGSLHWWSVAFAIAIVLATVFGALRYPPKL